MSAIPSNFNTTELNPIGCKVPDVGAQSDSKRRRRRALLYTTVATVFVVAAAFAWNSHTISSNVRWFASSRGYKAEVLAQSSVKGQLKHIEWDGAGGAPVGDWTVYLVFDPTDSLSAAARSRASGKFNGIPCDVDEVRRLESHWYTVTLAMNEWWEQCK